MAVDQAPIRAVLRALNPSVSHKAADKPNIDEIYAPLRHADALDPNRALVVGGRGVGKSFWAAVLANKEARDAAARAYPLLGLKRLDVYLGFHEGAMGTSGVAPSPAALKSALKAAKDPISIWRSVVMKSLNPDSSSEKLSDRVKRLEADPETFEDSLLSADERRAQDEKPLLLVFDALDVLAPDWGTIRSLTRALARLALEMSARRAVRLKLFMRRDQFKDMQQETFADFSKLQTAAVTLDWRPVDLYGALFTRLWRDAKANSVLQVLGKRVLVSTPKGDLPRELKDDEDAQEALFSTFAGEFMGTSKKRGHTYTWIPKHLADAHGETSLRSFLIALREAAELAGDRRGLAIDSHGLSAGVLKASDTRREELKEDNPWVDDALDALGGLTVPCDEQDIVSRWRDKSVVRRIRARSNRERPAIPVQLESRELLPEQALLAALIELGVIERRGQGRINVPDIFRVAARIKRKGGVAPRKKN